MKLVSLEFHGEPVDVENLAGSIGEDGFELRGAWGLRSGFLSYAGATLEPFDRGRSMGRAFAGAVLAGAIGAAIGGAVRHSIVGRWPSHQSVLVFELSTAELQEMVGHGALLNACNPGEAEGWIKVRSAPSGIGIFLALIAGLLLFVWSNERSRDVNSRPIRPECSALAQESIRVEQDLHDDLITRQNAQVKRADIEARSAQQGCK